MIDNKSEYHHTQNENFFYKFNLFCNILQVMCVLARTELENPWTVGKIFSAEQKLNRFLQETNLTVHAR